MSSEENEKLEKIRKDIEDLHAVTRELLGKVEGITNILDGIFTVTCPNCHNLMSTYPIPYFAISALHKIDGDERGIRIVKPPPQWDWKEVSVTCEKCKTIWHVCANV